MTASRLVGRRPGHSSAAACVLLVAAAVWTGCASAQSPPGGQPTLEQVDAAVTALQDDFNRHELTAEERVARAAPVRELLDRLIANDPNDGPAYAWRGKLQEIVDDPEGAEANYNRGCARSPRSAIVWYLRGMSRLWTYARFFDTRGQAPDFKTVPSIRVQGRAHKTDWREWGLADLERMTAAWEADHSLPEVDLHLAQAMAALCGGGKRGAEEALDRLDVRFHPPACKVRGLALLRLGRPQEAFAEFDRAVKEWPNDPTAWLLRGVARHARAVGSGFDFGPIVSDGLRQAIGDLDEALRLAPDDLEVQAARASVWLSLGDATAKSGSDPGPLLDAGERDLYAARFAGVPVAALLRRRGESLLHFAAYERARGRDARAICARAQAEFEDALAAGSTELETRTGMVRAQQGSGLARVGAGADRRAKGPEAIYSLEWALREKPGDPEILGELGAAWLALSEQRAASGLDPEDSLVRAIHCYCEAARRTPDDLEAYLRSVQCLLRQGDWREHHRRDGRPSFKGAIEDLNQTLARAPQHAAARELRGDAWRFLGAAEEALGNDPSEAWRHAQGDYRAAIELGASTAHLGLGVVQQAMGRLTAAVASFEAGAAAVPTRAAWANQRAAETRLFLEAAARDYRLQLDLARCSLRSGDYALAATRYAAGLALVEESLRALTPDEKARHRAGQSLRARLAASHYDLARIEALLAGGRSDPAAVPLPVDGATCRAHCAAALGHLRAALDLGLADLDRLRTEPDLVPIRDDPRFPLPPSLDH